MEVVKDIALLALMVLMIRKRVQIGHVLFICALLFGLSHRVSVDRMAAMVFTTASSGSTLVLFAALYLITLLEKLMRQSGTQGRLVSGLKNISGNPRFPMAVLPAIIGLLPSLGGARFSAPMVQEAARGIEVTPEQNAAINYYYRHVWEFFLPLYPSILLLAEITGIPLRKFIPVMLPYSIVAALIGILLYKNFPAYDNSSGKKPSGHDWKQIAEGLAPIAVIMVLVLAFQLDILVVLLLVITAMIGYYKIDRSSLLSMALSSFEPRLLYMIFTALYLRDVLNSSGSINQLLEYMIGMGLSPLLITISFPFILGFLIGVTVPGISISIPLVMTMVGPESVLGYASLAFAANFIGVMLSPVHLCLIMSVEHFSADFTRTYTKLLLPETIMLLFAVAYTYIL